MAGNEARAQAPSIAPELEQVAGAGAVELQISGDWCFDTLAAMEQLVARIGRPAQARVVLSCGRVSRLDLAGA